MNINNQDFGINVILRVAGSINATITYFQLYEIAEVALADAGSINAILDIFDGIYATLSSFQE